MVCVRKKGEADKSLPSRIKKKKKNIAEKRKENRMGGLSYID